MIKFAPKSVTIHETYVKTQMPLYFAMATIKCFDFSSGLPFLFLSGFCLFLPSILPRPAPTWHQPVSVPTHGVVSLSQLAEITRTKCLLNDHENSPMQYRDFFLFSCKN